jgi:hypothetical protein
MNPGPADGATFCVTLRGIRDLEPNGNNSAGRRSLFNPEFHLYR